MWRMLAILLMMLATLSVLENVTLSVPIFGSKEQYGLGFLTALLLVFVWLQQRIGQKFQTKRFVLLAQIWLFVLIVALFILRAVLADVQFEQHSPKVRQAVRAVVHIEQISDRMYDTHTGTAWRQLAVIRQASPQQNPNATTLITNNPFVQSYDTGVTPIDLSYLHGIQVLLTAKPGQKLTENNLEKLNNLKAGDQIELDLLLQPLADRRSATGFDSKRWHRSHGIYATAEVLSIWQIDTPSTSDNVSLAVRLQRLRSLFREHFYQNWHQLDGQTQQARAVVLSLLTGDRALIDTSTKSLYQLAGISHLLAISGTHVLFLAMILSGLAVWICNTINANIYQTLPKWQIRMAVMVLASLLYALFTGFEVPAARTVYMLIAMWVVRSLVLPIGQVQALALVAMSMVWFDPYVLWQAGFWLSFVAVLLLLRYDHLDDMSMTQTAWRGRFWQLAKLQFWLFVTMLPISILLFGKVSIWGVLVNLFAVSLFGAIIVPINLLAGVLYFVLPSLASALWQLSEQILWILHWLLDFLLPVHLGEWGVWLYLPVGMAGFALCLCVVAWLILPRILPKSVLILPAMALLFMLNTKSFAEESVIYPIKSDRKNISQHLLVHQAKTGRSAWLILADYGAKNYSQNDVQTTIEQLKRQGVYQIDGVIVQTPSERFVPLITALHEQFSVQQYWQAGKNQSVLAYQQPCEAGKNWQADGLSIRALTGWRQIDDEKVWACSLEIISDTPVQIVRDGVVESLSNADTVQMLFDASVANDDWAWQLWQMLCQSSQGDLDFRTIDGAYRLWFGFEQNESVAVKKFSPDEQLFLR